MTRSELRTYASGMYVAGCVLIASAIGGFFGWAHGTLVLGIWLLVESFRALRSKEDDAD